MSITNKIAMVLDIVESAEKNIRSAKRMLTEIVGGKTSPTTGGPSLDIAPPVHTDEGKIIEGTFDGQAMNGSDGNVYPVPANYASKSKLIAGDVLKLTINNSGSFIYKQIGPAPRKRIVGILSYENRSYKVLAEGKSYSVLLASVTYFKAEPGDNVTIIVPQDEESEWAAIENVLPEEEAALSMSAANAKKELVGVGADSQDPEDEDLDF